MTPEETAREQIDAMLVASGGSTFVKPNDHSLAPLRTRMVAEVERRLSVVEGVESVVSTNYERVGQGAMGISWAGSSARACLAGRFC